MGKEKKYEISSYEDNDFVISRSNSLISAKYKSTLLENKLLAIAIAKMELNDKIADGTGDIVTVLYASEIKQIMGKQDDTNLYEELKRVAKSMTGHSFVVEDRNNKRFSAFALITNVDYDDGKMTIKLNESVRQHLFGLKANFSTMQINVLMKFKRNSSYRIYELLSKEMYRCKPDVNGGRILLKYDLCEFRFLIGLADVSEADVQKEIAKTKKDEPINWKHLYDKVVIQKSYETWYDLKRKILDPAQKELEEKSDIAFEYSTIKSGKAVSGLNFYVCRNTPKMQGLPKKDSEKYESEGQYSLFCSPELYDDFVGHNNLTESNINLLFSAAGGDEEKVRGAIRMADRQEHIYNYMGWLLDCINKGYAEPIEVSDGSPEKAEAYSRMNDYKEETKRRTWEKIKENDSYGSFLQDIDMKEELIEALYGADDLIDMFTKWMVEKKTRKTEKGDC